MKKWLRNNTPLAIGLVLGAFLGFFYWKLEGFKSATSQIASDPLNCTLYGALLGGLFCSLFFTNKKKES